MNARLSLFALALAAPAATFAVELLPGVRTALPGSTVAERPNLAGTVVEDEVQAFSYLVNGATVFGTTQSRVVLSVDGTYDFYWRVFVDAGSGVGNDVFRVGNFLTDFYDGDWKEDGLGDEAPTYARLFAGNGVNFDFRSPDDQSGTLDPGKSSFFMFLDTRATAYARTGFYDFSDAGSNNVSGLYATFAPVPEPASLAALALGAGALLRRRRR